IFLQVLTSWDNSTSELTTSCSGKCFSGPKAFCLNIKKRSPSTKISSCSSPTLNDFSTSPQDLLAQKSLVRSKSIVANASPSLILIGRLVRMNNGHERLPLNPGSTCGPVPSSIPL